MTHHTDKDHGKEPKRPGDVHKHHHDADVHKHRDQVPPMHRIQRSLDYLTNVVTADLLVDTGVLITGVLLVLMEMGLIPHHSFGAAADHKDDPTPVVIVRRDDTGGEAGH